MICICMHAYTNVYIYIGQRLTNSWFKKVHSSPEFDRGSPFEGDPQKPKDPHETTGMSAL